MSSSVLQNGTTTLLNGEFYEDLLDHYNESIFNYLGAGGCDGPKYKDCIQPFGRTKYGQQELTDSSPNNPNSHSADVSNLIVFAANQRTKNQKSGTRSRPTTKPNPKFPEHHPRHAESDDGAPRTGKIRQDIIPKVHRILSRKTTKQQNNKNTKHLTLFYCFPSFTKNDQNDGKNMTKMTEKN